MTNLIHIKMNIKEIVDKSLDFAIKRLAEFFGIGLIILSFLLLIALLSYSPEDPNFIFPSETKINNLMGFKGSYTSDLLLQSIGVISFLIPFTIFFTGLNIIINKKVFLIINNLFFTIIYSLLGTLFFARFYPSSFSLIINSRYSIECN